MTDSIADRQVVVFAAGWCWCWLYVGCMLAANAWCSKAISRITTNFVVFVFVRTGLEKLRLLERIRGRKRNKKTLLLRSRWACWRREGKDGRRRPDFKSPSCTAAIPTPTASSANGDLADQATQRVTQSWPTRAVEGGCLCKHNLGRANGIAVPLAERLSCTTDQEEDTNVRGPQPMKCASGPKR
jgi:hypothetical protein